MSLARYPRAHPLWLAHILHRVSGLVLALFLPAHFWILSLALTDAAAMDEFLVFTDLAIVKLAEFGLVFLLAVHVFGGMRLMALEWLPWSNRQKSMAAGAVGAAFLVSGTFFIQAV
ncbi:MAG: succinate dehydrogenase, cytochrome b556 subunit [Pseudomonadota bacterium]